jgi:hypothetical protein
MVELQWEIPPRPAPPPDPRTERHAITVQLGATSMQTRVWLDGHDITQSVTRVVLDAPAGERTQVTLEVFARNREVITVTGTLLVEPGALEGVL